MRIGITGSEGLIGRALGMRLRAAGHDVRGLDLVAPGDAERWRGDVRIRSQVGRFIEGLDGVVHLAAVSRVQVAEADRDGCQSTNIDGTATILDAAVAARSSPWVLLASSREVYGEPQELPVREDAPLHPVNVYGRSKLAAEGRALQARGLGRVTAVLRFSNVYGDLIDHPDRVVPAFARASATGGTLVVEGRGHTFDFTHLEDTVRGILLAIEALAAGERALPVLHLTTGRATTLARLAEIAVAAGGGRARIVDGTPRRNDVTRFVGDPYLARRVLGWRAEHTLEEGVHRLVRAFADTRGKAPTVMEAIS